MVEGTSGATDPILRAALARALPGALPAAPGALELARLRPGREVGGFRLVAMLGRGGMGEVWEAEQASLGGRRVALKLVRPDRVSRELLEQFAREGRAGGRLRHQGLVTVHDQGESDGLTWIAMELVSGARTLRSVLDEAAGAEELGLAHDREVARLVAEVAEAMHAAHSAGVIHRDLKPQNVLLAPDGRPKVTDFGIARLTDEATRTETGGAGTPPYMSPEQVSLRPRSIDARTDVFSLGVVLYELLTLRRPFTGDTFQQIAAQIREVDPPDPRSFRSRIPRELAVIAERALEKEPGSRYASMAELAADLRRFLAGEPILAQPPTPLERAWKWVRRHPAGAGTIATAGVAFATVTVISLALAKSNQDLELTVGERDTAVRSLGATLVESRLKSADIAFQRGAWVTVLEEVAAARAAGCEDELELLLREGEALHALVRIEEGRARAEAVLAANASNGQRARALLLLAEVDLPSFAAADLVAARIEEALALGLPPASEAYARGVMAATVPEAEAHLREALRVDPRHFGANRLLLTLLAITGRLEAGLAQARVVRALFPDSAQADAAETFVHELEGRGEAAEQAAARVAEQVGPVVAEELGALRELARALRVSSDLRGFMGQPFTLEQVGRIQRAVGILSDRPGGLLDLRVPNLRCIRSTWTAARAGFAALLPSFDFANPFGKQKAAPKGPDYALAQSHFRSAAEATPDGFFTYMQAGCIVAASDFPSRKSTRAAWQLFDEASRQPSFMPGIRDAAMLWGTLCAATSVALYGDEELRPAALEGFRYFIARPELIAESRGFLTQYSWGMAEAVHALALEAAGRRGAPLDAAGWRMQAEILTLAGKQKPAIRAYERVLELAPDDAEARARLAALTAAPAASPVEPAPEPAAPGGG